MAKTKRMLVFVHGAWQLCHTEMNQHTHREMWVYVGTDAFCCYVDENKPTHDTPPKPVKSA